MTAEPYTYTDLDGADLKVSLCSPGILHVVASEPDYQAVAVCVPAADVRKVTAAMHEKAGLPDRWADLRKLVDADIDLYDEASAECGRSRNPSGATEARDKASAVRFIRVYMDDLEAGQ